MKREILQGLKSLNEDESKECNGGSLAYNPGKQLFPPIVYPVPDPDDKGCL